MRTLDEFRGIRPLPKREARAQPLQAIAQEVVRMEALTGDPAWDHFLSYLEAALKKTESLRDAEDRKLRDPRLVNDEAIRTSKARITQLESRIDTLNEILLLPKFLKERSALAAAQLDRARGA